MTIDDEIRVGQDLPPLTLPPVDRTTLFLFGGASGDHNPIHIDIDFARRAGMPDVFAHGMLGMAWMTRMLTDWVPQSRLRKIDVRFLGITHLGNVVTVTGKVTDIVVEDGERRARIALSNTNQFGQSKIVGEATIALA
jgi:acyl dehydratase